MINYRFKKKFKKKEKINKKSRISIFLISLFILIGIPYFLLGILNIFCSLCPNGNLSPNLELVIVSLGIFFFTPYYSIAGIFVNLICMPFGISISSHFDFCVGLGPRDLIGHALTILFYIFIAFIIVLINRKIENTIKAQQGASVVRRERGEKQG